MVNGPKDGGPDDLAARGEGGDGGWQEGVREVMMPDENGGYRMASRFEHTLGGGYADIKLAGSATQVSSGETPYMGGVLK